MKQPVLVQIGDTVVSSDLFEQYFSCDLSVCHGDCCVEGDAGAPLTEAEANAIEEALPAVRDLLAPKALEIIESQGVSYRDEDGDLVTSIIDGGPCVFTLFEKDGLCLCALEKAHREGKCSFCKPASCALYPVRLKEFESFTAVNFHFWKVCKAAFLKGKAEGVRAYEFLRGPLTARFGEEWYEELCRTAEEYLKIADTIS